MKPYFYFIAALVNIGVSASITAPIDPVEAEAWYKRYETAITEAASLDDHFSKTKILGEIVRKFGNKAHYHPDPQWREVFDRARSELLLVPGHAQYFADEIERIRLNERGQSDYQRSRAWYIAETLPHLPSPETILVLGRYLDDERDIPSNELPGIKQLIAEGKLKDDQVFLPENAWLAAYSLSNIGLRSAPVEKVPSYFGIKSEEWSDLLPRSRAWFASVKEGKRSFSFVGQEAEYRFKPDGTWETSAIQNPPDDAKVPAIQLGNPGDTPSPHQRSDTPKTPRGINRWWLAGMGTLLVAALGLWLRSRGRRPA